MKLRVGKTDYLLPPIGQLISVGIQFEDDTHARRLVERSYMQMESLKRQGEESIRGGKTAYFNYNERSGNLTLWPPPHKPGRVIVKFYPMAEEI